ncbi:MAG TPA: DNA replication/repair protein RecF [Microbacteriaceae bacterium]|nr:DNA replication/repair protein RecF [Microbacteriaceae bacterium]
MLAPTQLVDAIASSPAVWIRELALTRWRNHKETRVSLQPGVSLFVGPNGQGKTNILEAIGYLSTLASHRVNGAQALICDTHDDATIFGTLSHQSRDVTVGLTLKRRGASAATVSGNTAKVSEVPRWVSAVLFAPEDSAIVRGEPGFRRAFLDHLVISGSPSMAAVYQDFDRVLKQRNSLLKSLRKNGPRGELSTLDVWDESFISLSAEIVDQRMEHLLGILPLVNSNYATIAGGDEVQATYIPKGYSLPSDRVERLEIKSALTAALALHRKDEIDRGMSLIGPQRDDLELLISQRPARSHASQGETWSLALSLRLATATWLKQERPSGDPIIMLDDVFAELDAKRRGHLVEMISGYEQILITSAVEEDVPQSLRGQVFDVAGGVVTPR